MTWVILAAAIFFNFFFGVAENSSFLALTVATAAVAVEVHGMALGRLITGMVVSLTGSGCNFCIYSVFSSSVRPCHLEVSLDSPSSWDV